MAARPLPEREPTPMRCPQCIRQLECAGNMTGPLCLFRNRVRIELSLKEQNKVIIGITPQIPSVSVFCNPRTVDLTCTFQEQLIVVEDRFLAARNKNSISLAAQFF